MQEKYRKPKNRLYHIFVDLEKAIGRVPRGVIRWALRRPRVPEKLIMQILTQYNGVGLRVRPITVCQRSLR